MFSRRLLLVGLVLSCACSCQAAPSLSFGGVRLGQKWDDFLKAHPKAEAASTKFDDLLLTKKQQIARSAKWKMALLIEKRKGQLFNSVYCYFNNGILTQAMFYVEPNSKERELVALKAPLENLLAVLGTPTAQGATKTKYGAGHRWMLVWKTPTQSAFTYMAWPMQKQNGALSLEVVMVDAPWRAPHPGFQAFWPAILPPNQEDETRRREVVALLEELRPHSTKNIEQLKPAPANDLFETKSEKPSVPNGHDAPIVVMPPK